MQIQDFQFTVSVSFWHDGEEFNAQIFWDEESDEQEVSAKSAPHLTTKVADAIKSQLNKQIAQNKI